MIYTITTTLPLEHGGRTFATLRRNLLMAEHFKEPIKILTTNYNANYEDIYEDYMKKSKINTDFQLENMYDWLSGYQLLTPPTRRFSQKRRYFTTPIEIEGLTHKVDDRKSAVRYYDGDTYVLYRKYRPNSDILSFEDLKSPIHKKRLERRHYNKYGQLHMVTQFSPVKWTRISETFYDTNGHIYCRKYYSAETKKIRLIELIKDNQVYQTFRSLNELRAYYFDQRFNEGDIVFNDARKLDEPLLAKNVKTKNVLVFHNIHFLHEDPSRLDGHYRYGLEHPEEVSRYLILTQQQKDDLQREYQFPDEKFAIIPHFSEQLKKPENATTHRHNFVYIGRFSYQKQVNHLIDAYAIYAQRGNKTPLHLYGNDDDNFLPELKKQIKDLNIEDKVTIHGYTNEVNRIFSESKASLLTTRFEGFGLTIMESIANGCPVISYASRYGPKEIIDHGHNGYLVEPNDVTSFAKYMEKVDQYPFEEVALSEHLSESTAIQRYAQLVKTLKKE